MWILHDRKGQPINESSFSTAWQRLMHRALAEGLQERFTFHDLKAKGISDFTGDKKRASGHKTDAMVARYERKPDEVDPTK
jgi:hypothetical protein